MSTEKKDKLVVGEMYELTAPLFCDAVDFYGNHKTYDHLGDIYTKQFVARNGEKFVAVNMIQKFNDKSFVCFCLKNQMFFLIDSNSLLYKNWFDEFFKASV